jgi:hypothetical protein
LSLSDPDWVPIWNPLLSRNPETQRYIVAALAISPSLIATSHIAAGYCGSWQ